jgi:hypothetical protein
MIAFSELPEEIQKSINRAVTDSHKPRPSGITRIGEDMDALMFNLYTGRDVRDLIGGAI